MHLKNLIASLHESRVTVEKRGKKYSGLLFHDDRGYWYTYVTMEGDGRIAFEENEVAGVSVTTNPFSACVTLKTPEPLP